MYDLHNFVVVDRKVISERNYNAMEDNYVN